MTACAGDLCGVLAKVENSLSEYPSKDQPNLQPCDLVLLLDKNLRRNDWRSAVVETVHVSSYGNVRSCDLTLPSERS